MCSSICMFDEKFCENIWIGLNVQTLKNIPKNVASVKLFPGHFLNREFQSDRKETFAVN